MLKTMMLGVAILVPGAALAAAPTPGGRGDASVESICDQIGPDAYKCSQAWRYCHWDPLDGRCENNVPTSGCYQIGDPYQCNQAPGCVWDQEDPNGPRCEPTG
jgi:hypothetical protein